jgi:uncharacterized protein YuzE
MTPVVIKSSAPPVVEIDTNAGAAYVRFSSNKVSRTEEVEHPDAVVTIDFDNRNEVVGVELVGVREFSIKVLLLKVPITAPHVNYNLARYVPAGGLPAGRLRQMPQMA